MTQYKSFTFYLLYILRTQDSLEGQLVREAFSNRDWNGRLSSFRQLYQNSHPELVNNVIERFRRQSA